MLRTKLYQATLLGMFAVFLTACSTGKIVPTYSGEALPEGQQAVLIAPENISVVSVNGKEMPSYMLKNLETKYGLRPGDNTIVFQYESVWAARKGTGEDAARSQKVESPKLQLNFSATAGETYRFDYQQPESLREALSYVENISVDLHNAANATIATSELYTEKQSDVPAPVVATTSNNVEALFSVSNLEKLVGDKKQPESALDRLKAVWDTASAKEKKAFLVWAFQE